MSLLYEIAAELADVCLDGRASHGAWGHEKQFHADRASAELAMARLMDGGHWGCVEPPRYEIVTRDRAHFGHDSLGLQEWRRACKQAGIDPEV